MTLSDKSEPLKNFDFFWEGSKEINHLENILQVVNGKEREVTLGKKILLTSALGTYCLWDCSNIRMYVVRTAQVKSRDAFRII